MNAVIIWYVSLSLAIITAFIASRANAKKPITPTAKRVTHTIKSISQKEVKRLIKVVKKFTVWPVKDNSTFKQYIHKVTLVGTPLILLSILGFLLLMLKSKFRLVFLVLLLALSILAFFRFCLVKHY